MTSSLRFAVTLVSAALAATAAAQSIGPPGSVTQHLKIHAKAGGFAGPFTGDAGAFGTAVAALGDVDGDGIDDLAIGGAGGDDGGQAYGQVFVCFLREDGTVRASQKISQGNGGFVGFLGSGTDGTLFGDAVAGLGDIDGDGVPDLAVGAPYGPVGDGEVYVLRLLPDGKVKGQKALNLTNAANAHSGRSLAAIGDVDGDGVTDLAVGGFPNKVWIARLNADGSLKSATQTLALPSSDTGLGCAVCPVGDLDGDGTGDLAVGEYKVGAGPVATGTVRLVFLNPNGSVKSMVKIDSATPALTAGLDSQDSFGCAVGNLGDLDGDGHADIAVGAWSDQDGALTGFPGAAWMLFLDPAAPGMVKAAAKIGKAAGTLPIPLGDNDQFGLALAGLGDPDGDGAADLAVCSFLDPTAAPMPGAVWRLSVRGAAPSPWQDEGAGLESPAYVPKLIARAALDPQHVSGVAISSARPNSPAALIVGSRNQSMPLSCGVLVPVPQIVVPLFTDANGRAELHGSISPVVPPDFTHWMQAWVHDPTAACGLSASNAISATTH